jgi:hypothetical protein
MHDGYSDVLVQSELSHKTHHLNSLHSVELSKCREPRTSYDPDRLHRLL